MATYPENLSADVSGPLLFQGVALGVLDQVRHWAGSAELHDQLQTYKVSYWQAINSQKATYWDNQGASKQSYWFIYLFEK